MSYNDLLTFNNYRSYESVVLSLSKHLHLNIWRWMLTKQLLAKQNGPHSDNCCFQGLELTFCLKVNIVFSCIKCNLQILLPSAQLDISLAKNMDPCIVFHFFTNDPQPTIRKQAAEVERGLGSL